MSRRPRSGPAGPFIKWAGGKHSLLDQYAPFFPPEAATYYEPFVGSGAVFFYLRARGLARRYVLSDTNVELINVYAVVRDQVEELIAALAAHQAQHGREHYYAVRALDRSGLHRLDPVTRAARLIYLNRTCYNGLWRVNRKGYFNVPMGRYRRPRILDEARLRAASQALQGVDLRVQGFAGVADEARPGDLVYFDPPYVPLSRTANFTSYAADDFGEDEQRALAETFRALATRGCHVMLSNSDTPLVRELYAGFRIETIRAQRRINRDAALRGPIDEVLVLSG